MSMAEQLKARTRLALQRADATSQAVAARDVEGDAGGTARPWTRFIFNPHAALDEDRLTAVCEMHAAGTGVKGLNDKDMAIVNAAVENGGATGGGMGVGGGGGSRGRAAEAAHDHAIFGTSSLDVAGVHEPAADSDIPHALDQHPTTAWAVSTVPTTLNISAGADMDAGQPSGVELSTKIVAAQQSMSWRQRAVLQVAKTRGTVPMS